MSPVRVATDPEVHVGHHDYLPVGIHRIPEEAQRILSEPVRGEHLDIDPERGWVYLKYSVYQDRLNRAFGEEGWQFLPTSPLKIYPKTETHYRSYALFIDNIFMSEAVGDAQPDRGVGKTDPTFTTLEERCRYMALVRCCKDIGVALELWEKQNADRFKFTFFTRAAVGSSLMKQWVRKNVKGQIGGRTFPPR